MVRNALNGNGNGVAWKVVQICLGALIIVIVSLMVARIQNLEECNNDTQMKMSQMKDTANDRQLVIITELGKIREQQAVMLEKINRLER